MPLESKNPVTHDHDRQLMNVQTFVDLDARRRVMPRRRATQMMLEKDKRCSVVRQQSWIVVLRTDQNCKFLQERSLWRTSPDNIRPLTC